MTGKDVGCGHAADASQTALAFGVLITAAAVRCEREGDLDPLGKGSRSSCHRTMGEQPKRLWDAVLPAELPALPEE